MVVDTVFDSAVFFNMQLKRDLETCSVAFFLFFNAALFSSLDCS